MIKVKILKKIKIEITIRINRNKIKLNKLM